jgi:hypothetical protein
MFCLPKVKVASGINFGINVFFLFFLLKGDLCVFANVDGTYIYCQVVKMQTVNNNNNNSNDKSSKTTNKSSLNGENKNDTTIEYEFTVQIDDNGAQLVKIAQKDLYVLENWHRIYDAMIAKPPDERESFKYQDNTNSKNSNNNNGDSSNGHGNGHNGHHYNHKTSHNGSENGDENFSSNASDSDKSDTSSNYGSNENLSTGIEIEQAKSEVNQELRLLWGLEENERKKKINKLLLKWHPDKNTGKEKFASEVFKHLKKQIELYKTDPFLAGFYRSSYSSYASPSSPTSGHSPYGSGSTTAGGGGYDYKSGSGSGAGGDDYKSSRHHYGSYDDLHRKGGSGHSPSGGSPHSSPSRDGPGAPGSGHGGGGFDDYMKGPGASNLGRAGSFRQEWERRRQQKRQTTGTDPSNLAILNIFIKSF